MASTSTNAPLRPKAVITFAGALVAAIIGSGFASGQEIMQFFSAYGLISIVGSVIATILFGTVGAIFMHYGFSARYEKDFSHFRHFTGKHIGTFLEWFTVIFCFFVGVIMISGAGATIKQFFGVPQIVGSTFMALLVLFSAILGMHKITKILGYIGPVAIIFILGLASYWLITHFSGLSGVQAAIEANSEKVVYGMGDSTKWWGISAFMYVAYNLLVGVQFISAMGAAALSKREALAGGIVGGVALGVCCILLNLALLTNYENVIGYDIPMLVLVQQISPVLAVVFSVMLIVMIYNTAVPMVWTVASKLINENKAPRGYRILVVLLTTGMLIGGQLPFQTLVNVIYPFSGWFGAAYMILIALYYTRQHWAKKHAPATVNSLGTAFNEGN